MPLNKATIVRPRTDNRHRHRQTLPAIFTQ